MVVKIRLPKIEICVDSVLNSSPAHYFPVRELTRVCLINFEQLYFSRFKCMCVLVLSNTFQMNITCMSIYEPLNSSYHWKTLELVIG